jgi:hypothetical protein
MKTPPTPFTIHIIKPQDVVPYVAAQRSSSGTRTRPSMADALRNTGRAVVFTGRVTGFVIVALFRMIMQTGIGIGTALSFVCSLAVSWLWFMFITLPIVLLALTFLGVTMVLGWDMLDALYRGFVHLPRH